MDWKIVYFSEDLQHRILELPPGIQARYVHLTQRMRTFGPNLGMFYASLSRRRIIMLHTFVKKSQKTLLKNSGSRGHV